MNRSWTLKALLIGTLMGVFLVLLSMVEGIVRERQSRQSEVEQNVAESLASAQTLVGPVLVIPYRTRDPEARTKDAESYRWTNRHLIVTPETLAVQGDVPVTEKRRGIFVARVFEFTGSLQAEFRIPARLGITQPKLEVAVDPAYLAFGITDPRGVMAAPVVLWNGQAIDTAQGVRDAPLGQGFHAPVQVSFSETPVNAAARVQLGVNGVGKLAIAPAGKSTTVTLNSTWPHPSFFGRALPRAKAKGEPSFPATWSVSYLANSTVARLEAGQPASDAAARGIPDGFGVAFIDPVNIYLQSERAVKYGILFIGLTFAAFFLFELLRALAIHPLQYGLIGMALAVFYLLLLSLAEQIGFAPAYAAAAMASTALIGYYLASVMKSARLGTAFAAGLALLYGALFGLLQSEDNALLLGSVMIFLLLAGVMMATRRVDWYALTASARPAERPADAVVTPAQPT